MKSYVYEVTAFVELGWWVVHAVDIGRQVRVSTLAEVEDASRRLYAKHLDRRAEDIDVLVHVYRSTPAAIVRAQWRSIVRRAVRA